MRRAALLIVMVLMLAGCGGAAAPAPGPAIVVTVGGHAVRATIASTPEQRQHGLMGRTQIAADEGMLFVYGQDRPGLWYWMKNTPAPLSIAFIDSDNRIINMADMAPMDETTHHTAAAPSRYVLEVPQGWFARHGVRPGDRVTFTLPEALEIR